PIIVVTGFEDPVLVKKHPAIKFISKPFERDEICSAVQTQFKLGRLDKRVGAEVLNTLVEVCKAFAKQVLESEVALKPPYAKPSGQEPDGDILTSMIIKTDSGTCRMALGFEKSVLDAMAAKVKLDKNISAEKFIDVTLTVIFKLTKKYFVNSTGQIPKLDDKQFFDESNRNNSKYQDLIESKGVVIPISTDYGHIYCQAINIDRAQKAAA
ncbi:MAG: hypothetical protein KDD50_09015, partial [Bdellovibrionales bacterium]|nr:hypothetical protein [Bdellovibrionales bacterium]